MNWAVVLLFSFFPFLSAWSFATPDRIILKNGEVLEGTILRQTDHYVEIQIGKGQVIGFQIAAIQEIVHGSPAEISAVEKSLETLQLAPTQEWFVVEDHLGHPVGSCFFLQQTDTQTDSPGIVLEERWVFFETPEPWPISFVETLHLNGAPRELVYREGNGEGKLVVAQVKEQILEVNVTAGLEKKHYALPWSSAARFPLSARLQYRWAGYPEGSGEEVPVFHPTRLAIENHHYALQGKKNIIWQEQEIPALVLQETRGQLVQEELIDPKQGTLRREINGMDLVLRRATEDEIKSLQQEDNLTASNSRIITDPLGRYQLSLPDPGWSIIPGERDPGVLFLKGSREFTQALLFFVDAQTDQPTPIGHLPLVERRLGEALSEFKRESAAAERVLREQNILEFSFRFVEGEEQRAGRAAIIGCSNSLLVLVYTTPYVRYGSVTAEWEKLLGGLISERSGL